MKINRLLPAMVFLFVISLYPGLATAQTEDGENDLSQKIYSQQELDTLLAPIALYPDALLSQILMAATYPLEIVEADRWLRKNPKLTQDGLDEAMKEKPWDASVKSLCHYPKILGMMSDKLENTQALGNAFLARQDRVMDTIQSLRAKARALGRLESSGKDRVIVEDNYTTIETVNPDIVYIPFYDPCWVYGPWWYPVCQPVWFWWPDIAIGVGFFWGPPIIVGPIGRWCGFHWRQHSIFVDVGKTVSFSRSEITRRHGGIETWQHNPVHRRGVLYGDPRVAREFGRMPRPGVEARRAFRGFPTGEPQDVRPSLPDRMRRPGESTMPQHAPEGRFERPGGDQSRGQQRPMTPQIQEPGRTETPSAERFRQQGVSPFEGFGRSGSVTRQNSQRGFESMHESPAPGRDRGRGRR